MGNFVLDASMGLQNGFACFCPVDLDDKGNIVRLVIGMTYLSDVPPPHGKFVGIVHEDGQDAVEAFCADNAAFLDAMRERMAQ